MTATATERGAERREDEEEKAGGGKKVRAVGLVMKEGREKKSESSGELAFPSREISTPALAVCLSFVCVHCWL